MMLITPTVMMYYAKSMVGKATHNFLFLTIHLREVPLYPHSLLHHFLQEFSIKLTGFSTSLDLLSFFLLTALVYLILQLQEQILE